MRINRVKTEQKPATDDNSFPSNTPYQTSCLLSGQGLGTGEMKERSEALRDGCQDMVGKGKGKHTARQHGCSGGSRVPIAYMVVAVTAS